MASARDSDDLGRAFASMLNLSQAMPDVLQVWRSITDALMESRSRERPIGSDGSRLDPIGMVIQANALLFSNSMQYWLRWQQLVAKRIPAIRRRLEALKAERDDPSAETRNKLIDELRLYLREMADLPCTQCQLVRADIEKLEQAFLARTGPESAAPPQPEPANGAKVAKAAKPRAGARNSASQASTRRRHRAKP